MDRHLIYPPGWRKPRDDWDADPSLKGKPVPIPGTGLLLNTPEAIEAWIAERRRRWPSKHNVEDKKRKAREAMERGEIDPSELTAKGHKRHRMEGEIRRCDNQSGARGWRGRGRVYPERARPDSGWAGRGRGRGRGATSGSHQSTETPQDLNTVPSAAVIDPVSEDSDSNSDMDPVKDAVTSKATEPNFPPFIAENPPLDEDRERDRPANLTSLPRPGVRKPPQARAQPRNPFATRSSLLRNLLLPEIRHTVSNLSQAIHFIVDNDFFNGVELQPGEADSQLIKVLNSTNFTDVESGERTVHPTSKIVATYIIDVYFVAE
ncbi:hypothetical protein BU17DRAFT_67623 [Hysterangium stoloniferum]|nr:hypothetical protein BU17DRAFT_67623 [Hysterangium stoloniferum]